MIAFVIMGFVTTHYKTSDNLRFDNMTYYGISGIPLDFMKSYLTNRQQHVSYKNCEPELLEIETGNHQGLIMGLLFFSQIHQRNCKFNKYFQSNKIYKWWLLYKLYFNSS